MKKFILFFLFFCLSSYFQILKCDIPNCWKLLVPHVPEYGYYNPDLMFLDTCNGLNKVYGKVGYEIIFNNYVINIPSVTEDSILYLSWPIIDTSYTYLRNSFQSLENDYGDFTLEKKFPSITDSSLISSRTYIINFADYVDVKSVLNQLNAINEISGIHVIDYSSISLGISNINEPSLQLGELANSDDDKGFIFNQMVNDEYPLFTSFSYHLLSKSWHLYVDKIPMA